MKRRNITFQQYETAYNKFGDEGCVHLVEELKKNKTLKRLNIESISSNSISLMITLRLRNHC